MTTISRSILGAVLIAVGIHVFSIGVLSDILPREATPPLYQSSKTLRFPQGNFLRLAHTDGAVEVFAHKGKEFVLRAEIRAYGSADLLEAAKTYVESVATGTSDGAGIRIQTEPGERPGPIDLRVDYHMSIPEGTNLSVEGANGNVVIHEGCGAIFITGNNTDIKILSPRGAVRAESTNGRIKVRGAPGETILKTINGNIYAELSGGYLEADTTNGNIVAAIHPGTVKSCNLTSLNGGITLSVAHSAGVSLDAVTESGVVSSDLGLDYAEGYPKRRAIVGAMGEECIEITLHSRNGDINIVRSST